MGESLCETHRLHVTRKSVHMRGGRVTGPLLAQLLRAGGKSRDGPGPVGRGTPAAELS